ncbi:MAG: peptide chain release factor N(5)-glutamine methyltransferase [Lentisphaeria bacterium]|nr:peptide chain release factor N(5)-glutamine methyltransferase [Lentisphaeria bacterium]
MKTILEILKSSEDYLSKNISSSPRSDAEYMISHALGLKRLDLYVQFDRPLDDNELGEIRPLLKRCASGEPVQYILGSAAFLDFELAVGPGVLVPRPETELLVEEALKNLPKQGQVLDLCTGSGCILFGLYRGAKDAELYTWTGTDLSEDALNWAKKNQDALSLPAIQFKQGDLFTPVVGQSFDLITANPPYIGQSEKPSLETNVIDHEPEMALFAEEEGLALYQQIAKQLPQYLNEGGYFVTEIGCTQGPAVQEMLEKAGLSDVQVIKDYRGLDRMVSAKK